MAPVATPPLDNTMDKKHHTTARVTEFVLAWPKSEDPVSKHPAPACHTTHSSSNGRNGSTHELVYHKGYIWVSGQGHDSIARVAYDGSATFFSLPKGSAPHGLVFDNVGVLWITLQGLGLLWGVSITNHKNHWEDGDVEEVDVKIYHDRDGERLEINPQPHGIALDDHGLVWFTGKQTSTVGRVSRKKDGKKDEPRKVKHFPLRTTDAVPIYIASDGNGNMWCTELNGNAIARISHRGDVTEYPIPTANSRPISITKAPDKSMWFTEESGLNVGRIDKEGNITEFRVPLGERDSVLAALTFDKDGHFWVQQYVSPPKSGDAGNDYIVKLGKELHNATPGDITDVSVTFIKVPSQRCILHRIIHATDTAGTIWFTELGLDKIGRIDRNDK